MIWWILGVPVVCSVWLMICLICRYKRRMREIGKLQKIVENNLSDVDRLLSMAENEYKNLQKGAENGEVRREM